MSESLLIASESPCCIGALTLCALNLFQGSCNAGRYPSVFSRSGIFPAKTRRTTIPHSGDSQVSRAPNLAAPRWTHSSLAANCALPAVKHSSAVVL